MNKWQKLGLLSLSGVLLLAFWAGLWYQSKRITPVQVLASSEPTTAESLLTEEGKSGIEVNQAIDPPPEAIADLIVHIIGEVKAPGVYHLSPGSRINDAIELAQPLQAADLMRLNLALPLEDGMQIRVPKVGAQDPGAAKALIITAEEAGSGDWLVSASESKTSGIKDQKIDINTANQAQLETLPGIGPAYAGRILEYRESKGRFGQVEDLLKVKGIGKSLLNKVREYIVCSS